jgi:hypothetical protein
VGGGNRERFEKFVEWYGLQDKVLFTGFMANRSLHQLYRCADVAVFPSLYEPFGIVALEAMAAGAHVVASDAGGLKEVVLHDETGTSCFSDNPESLAWAVLKVLRDPNRADKLSTAAKIRLKQDFDWGLLADQTIAVYDQVWEEFIHSYWVENTVWPVSPGAEERAKRLRLQEKATEGTIIQRPRPKVASNLPALTEVVEEEDETEQDLTLYPSLSR